MLKHIIVLPDGTELRSGVGEKNAIMRVKLTDSVNVGEELTIGSAFANILEATVLTPAGGVNVTAGDEVALYKVDDTGTRTKKGVYILEKPTRPAANTIKITGYDRVIKLDKDLTAWLRGLTGWPYRLIDFAAMVCEACGLTLATATLLNEDFPVNQFSKAGVTGRQLMRWIGEICCRFCLANADGNMEFAWYEPSGKTITTTGDNRFFANSLSYDTYQVAPIDKVQLRLADGSEGALWPSTLIGTVVVDTLNIRSGAGADYDKVGTLSKGDRVQILERSTLSDGTVWGRISAGWVCITGNMTLENTDADNPYIITGNAILMARITDDLLPYLQVIENELAGIAYTPCKVSISATLDIRAGQTVDITDANGKTITAFVMTKTTSGQKDTLEGTGSPRRDSATAASNKSQAQIAQEQLENQSHEDVFKKLTKNGQIQGIYVQDGKWYINAELAQIVNLIADAITFGKLKSQDGRLVFDLDTATFTSYTTKGGAHVMVGGGALGLFDANSVARIFIGWDASTGTYRQMFTAENGSAAGSVGEYGSKLGIRCSDLDADATGETLAIHKVGWKTVNGEKVLVAYD